MKDVNYKLLTVYKARFSTDFDEKVLIFQLSKIKSGEYAGNVHLYGN